MEHKSSQTDKHARAHAHTHTRTHTRAHTSPRCVRVAAYSLTALQPHKQTQFAQIGLHRQLEYDGYEHKSIETDAAERLSKVVKTRGQLRNPSRARVCWQREVGSSVSNQSQQQQQIEPRITP